MDIEKEIENLKVQANHNLLTGYEELAEKQNQYAKWFEELLELREIYKNALDVVCNRNLECEQCDAYDGDLQRCVLKKGENE
jgi:hypothetical protein